MLSVVIIMISDEHRIYDGDDDYDYIAIDP